MTESQAIYAAIRRAFFYGVGFSFGFDILLQDYMGLEKYIEFVRTNWVEAHYIWGLLLSASCLLLFNGMLARFVWLKKAEVINGKEME
jgi:hypothetical protein